MDLEVYNKNKPFIAHLTVEELQCWKKIMSQRIKELKIKEEKHSVLSNIANQHYAISLHEIDIDGINVVEIPFNIGASSYDKYDGKPSDYKIESTSEQPEWYHILNHCLQDEVPLETDYIKIKWDKDVDRDDPISGIGTGYVYLYYDQELSEGERLPIEKKNTVLDTKKGYIFDVFGDSVSYRTRPYVSYPSDKPTIDEVHRRLYNDTFVIINIE